MIDLEPRDGLPTKSNKPTTREGYKCARVFIEALEASPLRRKTNGDPTTLRVIIENVFPEIYISKGDVYSTLVDLGYRLKPIRRKGQPCEYYANFIKGHGLGWSDQLWSYTSIILCSPNLVALSKMVEGKSKGYKERYKQERYGNNEIGPCANQRSKRS